MIRHNNSTYNHPILLRALERIACITSTALVSFGCKQIATSDNQLHEKTYPISCSHKHLSTIPRETRRRCLYDIWLLGRQLASLPFKAYSALNILAVKFQSFL